MSQSKPRSYRKRKRAESEEETRRRITEAAVELHGTVGPADTTLTEVAKRAGVSRMTVYNHFPTDAELFVACSSHWAARNPFPDPSGWTRADPSQRLAVALEELYVWYGLKQRMVGNVLRDVSKLPALAEVMEGLWVGWTQAMVARLAEGWPKSRVSPDELGAMLRVAVDFGSWRALTQSGLDDGTAAAVMTRMVSSALTCEDR